MPLDISPYNFIGLRTIITENAAALYGKKEESKRIKEIFSKLVVSNDPQEKIKLTFFQKLIYIIKPLYFYLYFDSVFIAVNNKIRNYFKNNFISFSPMEKLNTVKVSPQETLDDIVDRLETDKEEINEIKSKNSNLLVKINNLYNKDLKSDKTRIDLANLKKQTSLLSHFLNTTLQYISKYPNNEYIELLNKEFDKNQLEYDQLNDLIDKEGKYLSLESKINSKLNEVAADSTTKEVIFVNNELLKLKKRLPELSKEAFTKNYPSKTFENTYKKIEMDLAAISDSIPIIHQNTKKLKGLQSDIAQKLLSIAEEGIELDLNGRTINSVSGALLLKMKEATLAAQIKGTQFCSDQLTDYKNKILIKKQYIRDLKNTNDELELISKNFDSFMTDLLNDEGYQKLLMIVGIVSEAELKKDTSEYNKSKTQIIKLTINSLIHLKRKDYIEKIPNSENFSPTQFFSTLRDTYSDKQKQEYENAKIILNNKALEFHDLEIKTTNELHLILSNIPEYKQEETQEIVNPPSPVELKVEEIKKEEAPIITKKVVEEPSIWSKCDKFEEGMMNLLGILVGNSLLGNSDDKKPEGMILYNVFVLLCKLYNENNESIKKILPGILALISPEKAESWLGYLKNTKLKLDIDPETLDFLNYFIPLIFNPHSPLSKLMHEFTQLPEFAFNFDLDKLSSLSKFKEVDEFFFSKQQKLDKTKRIDLLHEFLGIGKLEIRKFSPEMQLLLLDIFRFVNSHLKDITSKQENVAKNILDNLIIKIKGYKIFFYDLLQWASYVKIPESVLNTAISYVVTEEFLKDQLGLKADNQDAILFEIRDSTISKLFKTLSLTKKAGEYTAPLVTPYFTFLINLINYRKELNENNKKELSSALGGLLTQFFNLSRKILTEFLNNTDFKNFLADLERKETEKKETNEIKIN